MVYFREVGQTSEVVAWLGKDPRRRVAYWRNEARSPLTWAADDSTYSTTGLAKLILIQATGTPIIAVRGPACWEYGGKTLADIAEAL